MSATGGPPSAPSVAMKPDALPAPKRIALRGLAAAVHHAHGRAGQNDQRQQNLHPIGGQDREQPRRGDGADEAAAQKE